MYETILVLLDGSQRAETILRHVEDLALQFRSRMIFLRIVEPASQVAAPEAAYMNLQRKDFQQRIRAAENYLAVQQGKFREIGIDADSRVDTGSAIDAIVKAVDREKVDLVAMAVHGQSRRSRVFDGSLAASLLQRIHCPLLVVRA